MNVCSRAGCRSEAAWFVLWRNPRIHGADRRKTWAACDEHVAYLRDYLTAREFPVEITRIEAAEIETPEAAVEVGVTAAGVAEAGTAETDPGNRVGAS